jgi:DNA-binding NtrC family response regulator
MKNGQTHIWLVEDDKDLRELMEDRLHAAEYTQRSFTKAESAINALNNLKDTDEKPDIIITDYDTKSNKNGLDVTKKAKEMGIPVIMLSASAGIKHQAEAAGATFFEKPYDSQKFMAAIQLATSQPPLAQDSVRTR